MPYLWLPQVSKDVPQEENCSWKLTRLRETSWWRWSRRVVMVQLQLKATMTKHHISKSQNIVFVLIIEVAYITAGNIYSNNLLLKLSSSVNSYKQHWMYKSMHAGQLWMHTSNRSLRSFYKNLYFIHHTSFLVNREVLLMHWERFC